MTYTEIYEELYAPDGQLTIAGLEPSDRQAWEVIRLFEGHKGFDYWWDGIADKDRDDLFDLLRSLFNDQVADAGGEQ